MGHDEQGEAFFLLELEEDVEEVGGVALVEGAGGFIGQEEFGLVDGALAIAARWRSPPESSPGR